MTTTQFDLLRSLIAIERHQKKWLEDILSVIDGELHFINAYRRWEEQLSLIKLSIHRAESKLLHYLLVPIEYRPIIELSMPMKQNKERLRSLQTKVAEYFRLLRLETRYKKLNSSDIDKKAEIGIITEDLAFLIELAERTSDIINMYNNTKELNIIEDLAFYHVISPWKVSGMNKLFSVLKYLNDMLAETEEL